MELMRVSRVAQMLGVCNKRVYQLMEAGRLDAVRVGPRSLRVPKHSLERYLTQQIEQTRRELGLDVKPVLLPHRS